jgi:lipopolysaccharide transport system permease protein
MTTSEMATPSAPANLTAPAVLHEPAHEVAELIIRPRRGWTAIDWSELLHYRELLYFLVWRDVKVRYKQTVLGVAWAVLQPLFSMLIFTFIFGRFAKIPSENLPYAVFVYAGLLPWQFFANGLTLAGQSLVNQQNLLTKVYFPRLFVPTASIGAGLVDMLISFGVYAVILVVYGIAPSWQIIYLPLLVLLTCVTVLGFSYLLAALTVSYRDFRFVIPFMVQAWMYASPVIYPVSMVPPQYQWLLGLNPMVGIIDAFRAAILGKDWNLPMLGLSILIGCGMFVFGMFYFRKVERRFADIA